MDSEFGMKRWAIAALAILAVVAIGSIAYQAGVSQGIALQPPPPPAVSGQAPADGAQAAPAADANYRYRSYGPWRFGFGWFGPFFSIILFFFVLRMITWGLFGWGWRRRWWHYYDYPDYGPSHFDDWHRRAHERMGDSRSPAPPSA
jgi:hypothetical protein